MRPSRFTWRKRRTCSIHSKASTDKSHRACKKTKRKSPHWNMSSKSCKRTAPTFGVVDFHPGICKARTARVAPSSDWPFAISPRPDRIRLDVLGGGRDIPFSQPTAEWTTKLPINRAVDDREARDFGLYSKSCLRKNSKL
jgi:hypothetical protein